MRLLATCCVLLGLLQPVYAADCSKALHGWTTAGGRHIQGTLTNEGGWNRTPGDSGGETYKGISRVNNPKWSGWAIIDQVGHSNKVLAANTVVQTAVDKYYCNNQWAQIRGDEFKGQYLPYKVFDLMVNRGNSRDYCLTVYQLSRGLIPMSNHVTAATVAWTNAYTKDKDHREKFIDRLILNAIQAYILIEKHTPRDRKFFAQWIVRVEDDE